jgi:apolipoprotein D and lipocalin family protein
MRLAIAALFLILTACAGVDSGKELPTAKTVDLSRYAGKWYEIARLPMWAQRQCLRSTAEYTLLLTGELGVRNACVTSDGEEKNIQGVATIVDQTHHAKVNVVFDQWAAKLVAFFSSSDEGNYWILRVDPEYRHSVVGTPDLEYLLIMARTTNLPESNYLYLVAFSQRLGFKTENLIRTSP